MTSFAAIDFETANYSPDSACAIGIVVVSDGEIVKDSYHLIRPPTSEFVFTHIHDLTWRDVASEPSFDEIWPRILEHFDNVDFLAAHNASFDKRVLEACCATAGVRPPHHPYVCTVHLARRQWDIFPTKLPDVCRHLDITLRHHQADSDAAACAQIVIAAEQAGWCYQG
jgi:DNA polymerase-3 subunit epsilon